MNLVILGGGESGIGVAILAKQKGYAVFVSDLGRIKENYKIILIDNNIDFEEEKHTEAVIFNTKLVIKSPGISDKSTIIKKILEKKISIISEIEFAFTYTRAKIIAITGSNGKTTTAMLTYHLLKKGGLNVGLAGNIGKSFALQVATENYEYYVLELSSFQLEGCYEFRPDIAVITNLSPDHLDRYDFKYENYIAAKFRITQKQTASDYFIYDFDDVEINNWFKTNETKAKLVPFSLIKKLAFGASLKKNIMEISINEEEFNIDTDAINLKGRHNFKNAMASSSIATLLGIRKKTIREGVMDFHGVEHRLENVLKVNGVQYINDSKATNVNSTFFALESLATPVVWLMGGEDKGNDYDVLQELVKEKVKAIICIGVNNKKIINSFNNIVDIMIEVDNMEEAVKIAERIAEKGDTVLLSPCCASYDLFIDYQDRGNQFKRFVRGI